MKKNIIAGFAISCVCIYFALRGINFSEVASSFAALKYEYVIPVLILILGNLYLRSYRWGIMINTLVSYDQWTLFKFSSIGFMAIAVLPARLGEFVRPYLVKQHSGVRMSATMATVVQERVFDLLTLMIFLFVAIINISVPSIIYIAGTIMMAVSVLLLTGFIFIGAKREFALRKIGGVLNVLPTWINKTTSCIVDALLGRLQQSPGVKRSLVGVLLSFVLSVCGYIGINRELAARKINEVLKLLPERLAKAASHLVESILAGLQQSPDVKKALKVLLLSFITWLTLGLSNYFMFYAFGLHLSIANAFAILAIIALGVMIPAAPGFIGTYEYACKLGLISFGIANSVAVSYAVALHFIQMMPAVILGLLLLPFQKLTLGGLMRRAEENAENGTT